MQVIDQKTQIIEEKNASHDLKNADKIIVRKCKSPTKNHQPSSIKMKVFVKKKNKKKIKKNKKK